MSEFAYIIGQDSMTLFIKGNSHTVSKQHENWDKIIETIKDKDNFNEDVLAELINPVKKVYDYVKGDIEIREGVLYYKGYSISNSLIDRIIKMQEQGFNVDPMLSFLNNLMQNPSSTAVNELYLFLEECKLPITPDGYFLAYKRVTSDYKDFYSKTIDNSIGQVVKMERNMVDDNRNRTCSTGLHFCSLDYLSHFYPGQGVVVIVKIHPKDVISIPSDYENTKGRCCEYKVVGEHPEPEKAFPSIVNSDYDDYEDSECDYDDYDDGYSD